MSTYVKLRTTIDARDLKVMFILLFKDAEGRHRPSLNSRSLLCLLNLTCCVHL